MQPRTSRLVPLLAVVLVVGWGMISLLSPGRDDVEVELSGRALVGGSGSAHRLVWLLANEFMAEHELTLVSVGLGGSNRGLQRLIDGELDIALASRELLESDRNAVPEEDPIVSQVVAHDHVAIVVSRDFPLQSITLRELGQALTSRTWTIEGIDVHRVLPSANSGTRTFLAACLGRAGHGPPIREDSRQHVSHDRTRRRAQ